MAKRVFTALVGLVVFFTVIFLPPIATVISVYLITLLIQFEFYRAIGGSKLLNTVGVISTTLMTLAVLFGIDNSAYYAVGVLYFFAAVATHSKINIKDVYTHGFLTIFSCIMMLYITKTRMEFHSYTLIWIFLIAWITDSAAFFVGCGIGKHKLAPNLSPKKTVEGSIGGVVFCVLCCVLYLFILTKVFSENIFYVGWYPLVILMGLIGSGIAQMGDLAASALKRDCNVKDFGSVLPGHGGVVDRFDSVILVAPFVYYAITILQNIKFE